MPPGAGPPGTKFFRAVATSTVAVVALRGFVTWTPKSPFSQWSVSVPESKIKPVLASRVMIVAWMEPPPPRTLSTSRILQAEVSSVNVGKVEKSSGPTITAHSTEVSPSAAAVEVVMATLPPGAPAVWVRSPATGKPPAANSALSLKVSLRKKFPEAAWRRTPSTRPIPLPAGISYSVPNAPTSRA